MRSPIALLVLAACSGSDVQLQSSQDNVGSGAPPSESPVSTEVFDLVRPGPVDLLFVVDTSPSMAEEQARLAASMLELLAAIEDVQLDFHLGFTTMDAEAPDFGTLLEWDGLHWIDASTPAPIEPAVALAQPGTDGAFFGFGRAAAYTLVELEADSPVNLGFLRPDAELDIVFVTDTDDLSGGSPATRQEFRQWLEDQPALVRAHTISGLPQENCQSTVIEGVEYRRYVQWTAGTSLDICTSDWGPFLVDLATSRLPSQTVWLSASPIPGTLEAEVSGVEVDGTPVSRTEVVCRSTDIGPDCTATYEAGAITFDLPLPAEGQVTVRYEPAAP